VLFLRTIENLGQPPRLFDVLSYRTTAEYRVPNINEARIAVYKMKIIMPNQSQRNRFDKFEFTHFFCYLFRIPRLRLITRVMFYASE
jgi:hypothetical protein